jgi:hypothetical protein
MPLLAEGGFSPGSVKRDGEEGGIPVNARNTPDNLEQQNSAFT